MADNKLIRACRSDDIEQVKKSLNPGFFGKMLSSIDINETDEDRKTALHLAVANRNPSIARLLIDAGADVNAKPELGTSPLYDAVEKCDPTMLRLLLDNGAELDSLGWLPGLGDMECDHRNSYLEVMGLLVAAGLDPDTRDDDRTLLMLALEASNREFAGFLLERGADINLRDNDGRNALIYALMELDAQMAELLIEKGADANACTGLKATPLHICARNGMTGIVKKLLERGADPSAIDGYGDTPLSEAASYKQTGIAKLLIDNGAEVNHGDNGGRTPLLLAVMEGHAESVGLFLENGADVNHRDNEGMTAMDHAAEADSYRIMEILTRHGATPESVPEAAPKPGVISEPDILSFDELDRSFGFTRRVAHDLVELIVFKENSGGTSMEEANRHLQWLDLAFEEGWPEGVMPRHHGSPESGDPAYRKRMVKTILEDPNYPNGVVEVDRAFLDNHLLVSFGEGQPILGTAYYHIAVLRK